eukprot:CAMPEP_0182539658 /NCGR_PEP_ID=MMETSP1323-20130603/25756_1 /TAXON_ID=236787 /ORGANISM="Florenciella parvula, Strain RCC1693" /LENGTH=37 /DNA_ID= /DNA_START= /DNA_END= /DNA_ORIENTATION=
MTLTRYSGVAQLLAAPRRRTSATSATSAPSALTRGSW